MRYSIFVVTNFQTFSICLKSSRKDKLKFLLTNNRILYNAPTNDWQVSNIWHSASLNKWKLDFFKFNKRPMKPVNKLNLFVYFHRYLSKQNTSYIFYHLNYVFFNFLLSLQHVQHFLIFYHHCTAMAPMLVHVFLFI